jgi:recombination protein RecT
MIKMANTENVSKALSTTPQVKSIDKLIEESVPELEKALPQGMDAQRMGRIALTSIRLNPELAKLPPESYKSFLGSLFTLAQIGLEPIAGQAYLLPFNNKGKTEVQAVIGYKGLKELFYRHQAAISLDMQTVRANDEFDYAYGTEARLLHRPAMKDRGEVIGYYAVAQLKGGGSLFRYMSKEETLAHGKRHSKSFGSPYSPWTKEPDAMGMKTVIIQLAKMLPMSVELQRAIAADETSRDFRPGVPPLDIPAKEIWDEVGAPDIDPETGEVVPPLSELGGQAI